MATDERHRDKNGEISRKHGNTLIGTLRKHYGPGFAKECSDREKLSSLFKSVDEPSLTQLIRDRKAGKLEPICRD